MILLIHDNSNVISVEQTANKQVIKVPQLSIVKTFFYLSNHFDDFLVWIHKDERNNLNLSNLEFIFHHKKIMASFSVEDYFQNEIGYVNDSNPSLNVNRNISYGTWFMSSIVGGIHLSIVKTYSQDVFKNDSFNYFLHSIAILGMYKEGLLCYCEPKLLLNSKVLSTSLPQSNYKELFQFVYQHQKTKWVLLLLLNLLVHQRKIPIIAFLTSFFNKKRKIADNVFDSITVQSTKPKHNHFELDVIIPTIGRKKYLYDVLKDFSKQTILPKKIIIVEQNPDTNSQSELDYINTETWPFPIELVFIHQTGACNARNVALSKTDSEWVFLADDDNQFDANLLELVFKNITDYGSDALTTSYLQKGEKLVLKKIIQWPTLGAGNSFVRRELLQNVAFDLKYEFGYREDADFGMQLRNNGVDLIYFPEPNIVHLKAPIGGFRTKPVLLWDNEEIQPKPSPTIMVYNLKYLTKEQLLGYKIRLFLENYKDQKIRNPFSYLNTMKTQWNKSIFWANFLIENDNG